MADDLFSKIPKEFDSKAYTAQDIEVLEGLEPVRRRPGMYIGGVDETALHHLVSEVFDNSMDEAVAGFATRIEVELAADGTCTIRDNGRGIPIDPHPKFPKKSALEVILTTLHSGGKFDHKVYQTSGGLHGVGISVVNALSDRLRVEVVRDKTVYEQHYSRGAPTDKLKKIGTAANRRGTSVSFHPDPEIFGEKGKFRASRIYKLARSKAYLFRGVEIRWSCAKEVLEKDIPEKDTIHFPGGIADYLNETLSGEQVVAQEPFSGEAELAEGMGRVEWAIQWPLIRDGFCSSYCNTVPTPFGGTHESGLKAMLFKGIKQFGEMAGNKKMGMVTSEDVFENACIVLSLFFKGPQFQGQTKDKLVNREASRLVENAVRDHFDHWLSNNPVWANRLLDYLVARAEERAKRRKQKDVGRKSIIQKLRLPGKLADCTQEDRDNSEIFLVEGDSAGGSAKQARDRATQAVLPLRGKILNVASATGDKIKANQEIQDMELAFGCGTRAHYSEETLRYDKVIIMTDADVDGAHIASLLMTYFFQEMPKLIENGHLYLAQPPLYRITQGTQNFYVHTDAEKDKLVKKLEAGRGKVEVGRFKGLGEMTPPQLKETTMDPATRTLLQVTMDDAKQAAKQVEHLMGKRPELRFQFIQEQSELRGQALLQQLDV